MRKFHDEIDYHEDSFKEAMVIEKKLKNFASDVLSICSSSFVKKNDISLNNWGILDKLKWSERDHELNSR